VRNSIVVMSPVSAADVQRRIEEAFRRSADIDTKGLLVEANDGTVVLTGTVRSVVERAAAVEAAWAAPGVIAIDDRLAVTP
jgi:osmotically-inducible protein OsmY